MTLKEIIQRTAGFTGQSDRTANVNLINDAAFELYNSIDLPGQLFEESFLMGTERFITLPYYVQYVRAVRPCIGLRPELNTPAPYYNDEPQVSSPWRYRIHKISPQTAEISEASTLEFRILAAESFDVTISLAGKTDLADKYEENVIIPAGSLFAHSTGRYEWLDYMAKDCYTSSNIEVYDANLQQIGFIPNHVNVARNVIIQVLDLNTVASLTPNCIRVLYKPLLNRLYKDTDSWEDPFAQSLLMKIREINAIDAGDENKVAICGQKSHALMEQAADDFYRGTVQRMKQRHNPFSVSVGWRL